MAGPSHEPSYTSARGAPFPAAHVSFVFPEQPFALSAAFTEPFAVLAEVNVPRTVNPSHDSLKLDPSIATGGLNRLVSVRVKPQSFFPEMWYWTSTEVMALWVFTWKEITLSCDVSPFHVPR